MIPKNRSLVTSALLVMLLGAFSVPVVAQHSHGNMAGPNKPPEMKMQDSQQEMMNVGRKGEVKFTSAVRVGQMVLKPGTYMVQHVIEGSEHLIVFKKDGNEMARVTCRLESLGQKAKTTALYTHVGDGGEKILDAVAVRGEDVKHVIPS